MGRRMKLRNTLGARALLPLALAALAFSAVACGEDSDSEPAYASVRRYEGAIDSAEIARQAREGFLPIISAIDGFDAYYLNDAGGGTIVAINIYRDEAGADASNLAAADFVRENLAPQLPNPPQITAGDVVVRKETAPLPSMHLTVRRYEAAIDTPELARRVRQGFVPIISDIDGFVSYYLIDAGGGVIVSVSVYRDEAGALASNAAAADFVRENLAPLLPNPPQITVGDVVANG